MKRLIVTDLRQPGIADRAMYARAVHLKIVDEIQPRAPESAGRFKGSKGLARPHAPGFGIAGFASGELIDDKDVFLKHWVAT